MRASHKLSEAILGDRRWWPRSPGPLASLPPFSTPSCSNGNSWSLLHSITYRSSFKPLSIKMSRYRREPTVKNRSRRAVYTINRRTMADGVGLCPFRLSAVRRHLGHLQTSAESQLYKILCTTSTSRWAMEEIRWWKHRDAKRLCSETMMPLGASFVYYIRMYAWTVLYCTVLCI
jgi:hypothetical protein